METSTTRRLAAELLTALGNFLRALFKSILYRTLRYESDEDRKTRHEEMQALLDAEHRSLRGWPSDACTSC